MENTHQNHLNYFLNFIRAAGKSPRTIDDYSKHISKFLTLVPEGTDDYRAAALSYLSADIGNNTYNLRFAYMKVYCDFCIREKLWDCQVHPLANLKKKKYVGRIVNIEDDDLKRLLALPDAKTFTGLRDLALIMVQLDTGIRGGEALALRRPNINLSALLVTVPQTVAKTRVERTMPMSPITADVIHHLLSVHHVAWDDATVFCTHEGKRLSSITWCHRVNDYGKQIGLHLSPYFLRHCAAIGHLRRGMSVFALSRLLGHSTLAMTQRYLALTLDDLRSEHRSHSLMTSLYDSKKRVRKIA